MTTEKINALWNCWKGKRVREFIQRQLENSRPAVRRKAKVFLDAHNEAANE